MKAALGLALLCCLVVKNSVKGCAATKCDNLKECACKNPVVIKAKVTSGPKPFYIPGKVAAQLVYGITTIATYKMYTPDPEDPDPWPPWWWWKHFNFIVVPKGCQWNLAINDVYYFFGHQLSRKRKNYLKIGHPKGFKKQKKRARKGEEKFLRQMRAGNIEC